MNSPKNSELFLRNISAIWKQNPESVTSRLTVILALSGVCLILIMTSKYGPGLTPDSICYILAARHLFSGDFSVSPYWPPLYPTLIGLPSLVGIEPIVTTRYVNAFLFGANIWIGCTLLRKCIRSPYIVALGMCGLALNPSLRGVCTYVWSEPLFIFLALMTLIIYDIWLHEKTKESLLLLSLTVALACLQRYSGVTLVLFGTLAIFCWGSDRTLFERNSQGLAFGIISVLPVALYLYYNYITSGTIAGNRAPSQISLYQNVYLLADGISSWFVPGKFLSRWRIVVVCLLGLAISLPAIINFTIKRPFGPRFGYGCRSDRTVYVKMLLWFTSVYVCFLLVTSTLLAFDAIDGRLLAPVAIPILILVLWMLEQAIWFWRAVLDTDKIIPIIVVGLAVWLVGSSCVLGKNLIMALQTGIPGYQSEWWIASPVLKHLKTHVLGGTLYSNDPLPIVFFTGLNATQAPDKRETLIEFISGLRCRSKKSFLVWFYDDSSDGPSGEGDRKSFISAFATEYGLVSVERFPQGIILEINGEPLGCQNR